jgi:CheY-like chemotaxis protein
VAIRVLLVDDVPEVRRLVRTALRFRGLFSVVGEAADGTTAITLTEQLRPDIVVLDIGLPDLAGKEVLTGLRVALPSVKVVVFSGTEPEDSAGIADEVEGTPSRTASSTSSSTCWSRSGASGPASRPCSCRPTCPARGRRGTSPAPSSPSGTRPR